jgi:hypothetical protein
VLVVTKPKPAVVTKVTFYLLRDIDDWIEKVQGEERLRTGHKPPKGQVISEKLRTHPDFMREHPQRLANGHGHAAGAHSPSEIPRFPRD